MTGDYVPYRERKRAEEEAQRQAEIDAAIERENLYVDIEEELERLDASDTDFYLELLKPADVIDKVTRHKDLVQWVKGGATFVICEVVEACCVPRAFSGIDVDSYVVYDVFVTIDDRVWYEPNAKPRAVHTLQVRLPGKTLDDVATDVLYTIRENLRAREPG